MHEVTRSARLRARTSLGVLALGCAALVACTSKHEAAPLPPEDGVTKTGVCDTVFFAPDEEHGYHVDECSYIAYATNPPSSGHHYAVWADFKSYRKPFAPGFWVHSIEHGGVALLYGCDRKADAACAQMVTEIEDYMLAVDPDPMCEAPTRTRLLSLPFPTLGAAFAAVAWGHYLRAECFDAALVATFIDHYYGQNYEDLCASGFDPTSGVAANCGKP